MVRVNHAISATLLTFRLVFADNLACDRRNLAGRIFGFGCHVPVQFQDSYERERR